MINPENVKKPENEKNQILGLSKDQMENKEKMKIHDLENSNNNKDGSKEDKLAAKTETKKLEAGELPKIDIMTSVVPSELYQ